MKSKILKIIVPLMLSVSMASCGSNIFDSFVEEENNESLTAKIENAESRSDYEDIISDTDTIITASASSNSEKQEAYFIKAEATMGRADLSTLDLFSDIAKASDDDDVGAEKKISKIALRGGINQGYIGGGIGINLTVFHVNYAFFGEELGEKIGYNSLLTHNIQFGFSF